MQIRQNFNRIPSRHFSHFVLIFLMAYLCQGQFFLYSRSQVYHRQSLCFRGSRFYVDHLIVHVSVQNFNENFMSYTHSTDNTFCDWKLFEDKFNKMRSINFGYSAERKEIKRQDGKNRQISPLTKEGNIFLWSKCSCYTTLNKIKKKTCNTSYLMNTM